MEFGLSRMARAVTPDAWEICSALLSHRTS